MNRKMRSKIANAEAKVKRIRAERKRENPDNCESCGNDWADHDLGIEDGKLVFYRPEPKGKLN